MTHSCIFIPTLKMFEFGYFGCWRCLGSFFFRSSWISWMIGWARDFFPPSQARLNEKMCHQLLMDQPIWVRDPWIPYYWLIYDGISQINFGPFHGKIRMLLKYQKHHACNEYSPGN